jgi:hypothetical protein
MNDRLFLDEISFRKIGNQIRENFGYRLSIFGPKSGEVKFKISNK